MVIPVNEEYKSKEKIDPRTDEKYVVVNTKKDLNDERGMI